MFTDKDLRNLIVPLFIEQFLLMFVGIADTFVVSVSSEADVSGGLRVLSVDHHAVPAVPRRLRCGGGAVPQYRENRRDHERFHCRQRHQCGRQLCGRIHPAFYFKKLNKITLVLINNIFNGLAYPFAGSLGNGLRRRAM